MTAHTTESLATAANNRAVSGMRPTGALHIGHYFGVLKNWVAMQETMQTYFFVADWHALTSEYENPARIKEFIPENAIHTNDSDSFSLIFPEQTKSKNELYNLYQEQVKYLKLFKEERAKYYASMI